MDKISSVAQENRAIRSLSHIVLTNEKVGTNRRLIGDERAERNKSPNENAPFAYRRGAFAGRFAAGGGEIEIDFSSKP